MSRTKRVLLGLFFVVLALSLMGAAFAAIRPKPRHWHFAALDGSNEVPAVATEATGLAQLFVDVDQGVKYRILADELDGVTTAHIHYGAKGENGPVVATLLAPLSEPSGPIDRLVVKGFVLPEEIGGPFVGDWRGFVRAFASGDLYVNVHTADYPGGELRGQIVPKGPTSPPASRPMSRPLSRPHPGR